MNTKRILTRIYVNKIETAIDFYEKLTNEKCANRFEYKQARLEIARVNNLLIIAGSGKSFVSTLQKYADVTVVEDKNLDSLQVKLAPFTTIIIGYHKSDVAFKNDDFRTDELAKISFSASRLVSLSETINFFSSLETSIILTVNFLLMNCFNFSKILFLEPPSTRG